MFVITKRGALYQRIILNLESIFSVIIFIEKNPYFTMFLLPIELMHLDLEMWHQKSWIKNLRKKLISCFALTAVRLLKHWKSLQKDNATKYFIVRRKNKKTFDFFSSRKWFINHKSSWDISVTEHKNTIWWERPAHYLQTDTYNSRYLHQ